MERTEVVILKFARFLYTVVTGIVLSCLLIVGLFRWQWTWPCLTADSGAEEGWQFANFMQPWGPVALVCYIVAAMGVIWLGWYWLRLAGTITSIAKHLRRGKSADVGPGGNVANVLGETINERVESDARYIAQLEEQIEDLKIQIQLSQRQEKNTEAIIYSIRDAVIVVDEFDKLLMANDAAGKLFNFDFAGSRHKPIGELVDPDKGEFVDVLRHSRQSRARATRKEIEFLTDAEPKTYDCIISCVYDQNRQVCGAVAVLHDITREKQIQQAKTDFVSHVSHELKTPLASVTAYSEMLADGEANDQQMIKEFCSVIQSQAKRLNRLIEDILNVSRIESGLVKVEKKPVSLTILIEEQLQMMKGCADEKNIKIIRQKPIVFDQVSADRDMISQVIVNLLSNAVKYTPAGGSIKIETDVDETANLVRVGVTDTGVGIPENEIERVFDKFYRVGANQKKAKGTGLGLNLVKQIVEKVHDGRVFVTSKVGVGSTFGFELPLAMGEAVHM
jgi:two-component system phosphate regulon sensor histidine kinase PhoR